MNKHIKLAILIAPFLAIGGYIATDYYDNYKIDQKRYHKISVEGNCDVKQGKCLLKGAGLLLEFSTTGDITNLESSYPLDSAAIGLKGDEKNKPHNLKPDSNRKNWTIPTREYSNSNEDDGTTIRIIVSANDHLFFSEFTSTK